MKERKREGEFFFVVPLSPPSGKKRNGNKSPAAEP